MEKYIYQYENWPNLTWDDAALSVALGEVRLRQGQILGSLGALGFSLRSQTAVASLSDEIIHSSEIEGERLDADKVRSSVARRLGVEIAGLRDAGRDIEGIVEMMLDATRRYDEPLTAERLFNWHAALFPTGRSGLKKIIVGAWREEDMQIVSGAFGRERVHYEAPPPEAVPDEMSNFLDWLNGDGGIDPVVKAGVAHFRFVVIHPFDDGNGRLARAVTEMLLARSDRSRDRYYSLSSRLLAERRAYYDALHKVQFSSGDITEWLAWYLGCLGRALAESARGLEAVSRKADFWDRTKDVAMNDRQRRMVGALLDGFDGRLTTTRWAKITKCSHDTALRDIKDLMDKDVLEQEEGGSRNTAYRLAGHGAPCPHDWKSETEPDA